MESSAGGYPKSLFGEAAGRSIGNCTVVPTAEGSEATGKEMGLRNEVT